MSLFQIKKGKDNNYLIDDKIYLKTIKIADPTYDLTFKNLFSSDIDWKKRAISLLQTLVIKNKINDIKVLNNEFIKKDINQNKNGEHLTLLRSDLSFQLKIQNENENEEEKDKIQLINIEMQLGYPINFLDRLIDYGLLLKKNNKDEEEKIKTIVIGFMNYKKKNIYLNSNSYFLAEFSSKDNNQFLKKMDFIDIIIIDLKEMSEKLEKNEDIYIYGKKINEEGKNWLKLLGVRHWGNKDEDKYYYEIPILKFDDILYSAIQSLNNVSKIQLESFYNNENEYLNSINKAAEEIAKEKVEAAKEAAKKKVVAAKEKVEAAKEKVEAAKEAAKEKVKAAKKKVVAAKKKVEAAQNEKLNMFIILLKNTNNLDNLNLEQFNFSEEEIKNVISKLENEEKKNYLQTFLNKKRNNLEI